MPKKKRPLKRAKKTRSRVSRKTKSKKPRRAKLTLKDRMARARKLEALDGGKPTFKVLPRALTAAPNKLAAAPPPAISGSVGRWEAGARNVETDVKTVQRLLEAAAQKLQAPDLDPKGVDGKIARDSAKSNTVAAIEAFQKRSNISVDGLIEPGLQTWQALVQAADGTSPLPNGDSQTYISEISVSLDDPDHWLTLTWTGPNAGSQETGPFRTSPGAGLRGLNCDDESTSQRSGSKCTPKGTYPVQGFARRLNSDSRATYVTWFMQRRGIALHYFPSVPEYAASHGCVRIQSEDVARLIQKNSRVDETQVVVSGTWTKPPKQWS
ncbi:MAG TPA: L,D-transpeptidase family protein [Candidatus Udaeobacter sp.]|nr:L,D-transpeptidase family protein [Candidatus Udaeobacter sp.]